MQRKVKPAVDAASPSASCVTGAGIPAPVTPEWRSVGSFRFYSLPTTWASTCDIWSWGLNSTILTVSSTTTVCPAGQ